MSTRPWWLRYAVAFGATALAIVVRLAFDPILGHGALPFVTLFPTVVLIAWFSGLAATLVTLPVGAIGAWFFILPPAPGFGGGAGLVSVVAYLITGGASAVLGHLAARGGRFEREREAAQSAVRAHAVQVRRSEEQLALISDTVPALISYVDRQFRYRFVNRAYTEWFGLSQDAIVGRPMQEVLGPEVWTAIEPGMRRAMAGETADFETEARYAHGGTRWVHAVYTPHRDPGGQVHGVVIMVFDITRRRRAEDALREADRRKDEFLAMLAHELRNPLAPIRTGLELLRRAETQPDVVHRVRPVLERQVGQMVRLIDDLVDVSRISSGRIHLQRNPAVLETLVTDAVEANRGLFETAGVELVVALPDAPTLLDVDPARFVQVVSNLLNNAAKFSQRGGRVKLECAVERGAGHGELVLSVRDTGVGIAADLLPRVFDLFVQGDAAGLGRPGLGVGLALARQLVELHGGRIEAESAGPGRGSVFTVRLPVLDVTESPTRDERPVEAPRLSKRVLVVDDNQEAAEMVSALVESLGGEARAVFDGEEGVRCAAAFSPDVVLLDLAMPQMDGFETCRRLRAEPFGRDAFVVALTGWGQPHDREQARASGFDAFLTKPADPQALAALLTSAGRAGSATGDR